MIKLNFRNNTPCITCLFLLPTGKANMGKWGPPEGRVQDQVEGRHREQMTECSRGVLKTSVLKSMFFLNSTRKQVKLTLTASQDFIVNGSEKFSEQYSS